MPEFIDRFIAAQLRKPYGWFGSLVITRVMNRVNAQITNTVIDLLEIRPDHQVLEVGFGGGPGIARLANTVTTGLVCGLDLSTDMVRKAERRFQPEIRSGRVRVQVGDISRLPFPDGRFDRMFTINTIYFWPDTSRGLSEIQRVLKTGGKAAIGIRSRDKMQQHSVTKHNFRLFTGEEIAELMREAGFRDLRIDHRDQDKWYDQVIVIGTR